MFPVVGSEKVLAATDANHAVINASGNSWTLENNTLRTEISFSNGSIKMKSFYNKRQGQPKRIVNVWAVPNYIVGCYLYSTTTSPS